MPRIPQQALLSFATAETRVVFKISKLDSDGPETANRTLWEHENSETSVPRNALKYAKLRTQTDPAPNSNFQRKPAPYHHHPTPPPVVYSGGPFNLEACKAISCHQFGD